MNVALRRPMDVAEFLAWEQRQELRYEFDGLKPVAMVGGTEAHGAISISVATALQRRLQGTRCRAFGSDMKIEVAGRIRYPDALIVCRPLQLGSRVVNDPVVVFEVLSETTAQVDRFDKNEEYRLTPSIQRYVMLEQDRPTATVFNRAGDDWVGRIVGPGGVIGMPEIGIELPLPECYEGIEFPPRDEPAAAR